MSKHKNIEKISAGTFNYTINLDKMLVTCVGYVRGLKGVGMAKCNPEDSFNLTYGMTLARLRAIDDAYSKYNDFGIDGIKDDIKMREDLIKSLQAKIDSEQNLIDTWKRAKREMKELLAWTPTNNKPMIH